MLLRRSGSSLIRLVAVGLVLSGFQALPVLAQAEAEYIAQTTQDPSIPEGELALLVKPLTKSELIAEADAWLDLVQQKVRQLSAAEIAVKRKNDEIAAAEETAEAVEEAQAAVENASDAETREEASEAAREAQEAAQRATEVQTRVEEDEEVRAAVEQAQAAAPEPVTLSDSDLQDADQLAATAKSANQAAEATEAEKENLLNRVNQLREERTALADRTRVVLDEIVDKGGDIEEYDQYLRAVSEIDVDASDWKALQATILGWFTSDQGGIRWGLNIAKFMVTLAGFWLLSLLLGRLADRALKTRYTKSLSTLMRAFLAKMIRRAVLVVGFVVALAALEVNTGPLLAAIGAAGFVVAFALQDSLSNFASGIMILMYRPFDVGDVVETGGVSGKVTSLNLVSVTISTFDNKIVIVPNNKVWNDTITNATSVKQRRVDMVFGIGYDDDIAKAQAVLERVVSQHELVLNDPQPVIKLHELADSSVNFICRPWVKTDDYWTVYWDITRTVKEAFDQEGISIPYPQQDVHMHNVDTPVSTGGD